MKRRIRLTTAILLAVLMLAGCGQKQHVPELLVPIENPDAVYAARRQKMTTVTVKEASICPDVTDVKFDFDSCVYDIKVKTGDFVEEGDVLFYLDKDLEVRMKEAEVELMLRKKDYEVAVKQHNDQIKNLKNLKNMFANMQDWYDYNLFDINIRELETQFSIRYDSVYQEILEFEDDYLELKEQFENSEIKAPVSGQIVYLGVMNDEDPIYEDNTVVSIAKQDTKLLCCELIEEKEYNAYTDVKATIRGKEYDITYIPYDEEELYNKKFQSQNLYSYFTVEGLPDDVEFGEYATIQLTATSDEELLIVPSQAVTRSNGQNYVRVVSGDRQGLRAVTIGIKNKNYTEITSGLSEGETVFVANNLTRYGVNYESTTAKTEDYRMSGSTPVVRRSMKSDPVINPVPGKIKEIYISTYSQVFVTEGQKLYSVVPEIKESDWEEARQNLKLAQETYAKKLRDDKEALDKQLERLRNMSAGVEKELAQLKYDIAKNDYEQYKIDGQEQIDKCEERLANYDVWGNGEPYVVYAEKEGYISSFAKYTVGKELEADQEMCELYYPDSLFYGGMDEQRRFRYGMTVTVEYSVEGQTVSTTGKVISAYDVRPEESSSAAFVFVTLSDEQYKASAANANISAEYCSAENVITIPTDLVYREVSGKTEETDEDEELDPLTELLKQNLSDEEQQKGVPYVWAYDENGQVVKRYVTIVEQSRERTWICDGITTADSLVVH